MPDTPVPQVPSPLSPPVLMIGAGSILVLLSFALPWVTISSDVHYPMPGCLGNISSCPLVTSSSTALGGMETGGWIALAACVVALVLVVARFRGWQGVLPMQDWMVFAGLGAIEAVVILIAGLSHMAASQTLGMVELRDTVSTGFFVALLGAALTAVGGLVAGGRLKLPAAR